MTGVLPIDRLLATLQIVQREGRQLRYSRQRLFSNAITAEWVVALEKHPEIAERVEAFGSRFGRMQDTFAEKLFPRWLLALAEQPGSLIETLNRAERLGVLQSADAWLEARKLRNRLVHEYMEDPALFATDLNLANGYAGVMFETYNCLRADIQRRLQVGEDRLPAALAI